MREDVRYFATDRHAVYDGNDAFRGLEFGLEHEGAFAIAPAD
jgi:hypothetical protein